MVTHILHVSGTHCQACKLLLEDMLVEHEGVSSVLVDIHAQTITIHAAFEHITDTHIAEWNMQLIDAGYRVSREKMIQQNKTKHLLAAFIIGGVVLVLFYILQKSGILAIGLEGELTWTTGLLIGVIASISTCLAVVGGLILSFSAKISQDTHSRKPIILFHIGRISGFILLGGVLGALGKVIGIHPTTTAALGIVAAIIMIILGINLLDVFKGAKRLQLQLPSSVYKKITSIEKGWFAPVVVGVGTFFLPCGFTQSMQFVALSSGSFSAGALLMGAFVIGTFPILATLSFGSLALSKSPKAPLFFKTAGVVVIGLGVFALLSGLAGLGIIKPFISL